MRALRSLSLLALLVTVAAPAAAAEKPIDSFGGGVTGLLGVGTPVGLAGIEGRLDPVRWAYLTAGLGLNPAPQMAAMFHLRRPFRSADSSRQIAVSAGYGISYGKHKWQDWTRINFDQETALEPHKEGMLWWHNVQLDLEARQRSAGGSIISFGMFAGLALAGNPRDMRCVGYEIDYCEQRYPDAGTGPVPYGGFAAGIWFH